ncbi:unnamed protein product (macronuclear) [Paramecium tetraurelia]|uniref:TORTIFOLIA1/SINE1-2 N-terminal domain-containing protein n=1 Tax=Paramecium tetraurelia TaxID=5888 RepID=A0E6A2_PARTE|nr:uncharacterized protein GSPATT00003684001 [Paramecium tetraurelia]CAK90819.1 unnamed protein product [Paramecium tetraurelia]|eukprot:XP_001458216.1 hypothetical protein (macronuclear) [Paramecium tetraurelia strain d4-2]
MNSNTLNKSRRLYNTCDSNSQLRTILLASLAKLHSQSTAQTGYSELRTLIAQLQQNQFVILTNLLDSNDISKQAKKDYIKVFGVLAEIRGSDIQEQLPRIVQIINKRIQEGDSTFIQVISDTFANINEFTIQTSPNKYDLFQSITELLQANFVHNNRVAQQISAQSLCRIIQTTDQQLMEMIFKTYTQKTLEILKSPHCKTQQGLLESLLSLILTVEGIFEPCLEDCVHTITNCLHSEEWNSRKFALDIIYSLSVIFPHYFRINEQFVNKIGELRFDKIKHVRDAAQVALSSLKDSRSLQQQSAREHKSVFKSSANKGFFERTSDIQIIENRPREEEISKQKPTFADILVKNETHSFTLPNQQMGSDKKTSPVQMLADSNKNHSPQCSAFIQAAQPTYHFNISGYSNQKEKKYINQSQEISKSQIQLATPPQKQIQDKQDLLKLYDSAKAKQNAIFEQILNQKLQISEQNTRSEMNLLNKRIDKIEQLLERMSETIDKKLNSQQNQQLQQQQQITSQKQKVVPVESYKDQFIPCQIHENQKSLNLQNQNMFDSLNDAPNTKMQDIFFIQQKSQFNTESKLQESNFELNSGKISDAEGKFRENHQRSTSEASPLRNKDQSILTTDSKQTQQQLSSPIIQNAKVIEQQKVMQKVEDQLDKNNINEAYCTALTSLDDQIIISTMMKTGPCTERLDSTQVEYLLHKLRTLDWIENALQHHLARMPAILLKSISTQLNNVQQTDQVKRIQDMIEKKKTQSQD